MTIEAANNTLELYRHYENKWIINKSELKLLVEKIEIVETIGDSINRFEVVARIANTNPQRYIDVKDLSVLWIIAP